MTPLEELQAAHKRLSELRDRERVVPGQLVVTETEPGQLAVHEVWMANVFEKLNMLHRTIDAQLAILEHGMNDNPDWYGPSYEDALRLARAINGEA